MVTARPEPPPTPGQAPPAVTTLEDHGRLMRGQALRPEAGPDTVVICPPEFLAALEPWLEFRRQQGHQLEVVSQFRTAEDIRSRIRGVAQRGRAATQWGATAPVETSLPLGARFLAEKTTFSPLAAQRATLRNVLLVGDTTPAALGADSRLRSVPTHFAQAVVNVRWGSEPQIATDNWYADLDDDGLPELAIGRLPVETPEELTSLVRRIRNYEQQGSAGLWRRRVNLVAGLGGFGVLTDALLETAARSLITRGIPAEYQTSMTYASWRSPYCPDPRSFRLKVLQRLNEGCLLWVYMGHGRREGLDWVQVPVGVAPILERDDVVHVRCHDGPPIAVFLSCYTAAFDDPEDCLAERLLLQEDGPVAVLGGSRVTLPYGMAVLGSLLMDEMFQNRRATLGEIVLEAKRRLGAQRTAGPDASWLDLVARVASPTAEQLVAERREHVLLFNLLGDPLLRVPQPLPMEVRTAPAAVPGQPLAVELDSPVAGQGVVELVSPRGALTFSPPERTTFDGSDAGMRALDGVYERAREDQYLRQPLQIAAARSRTVLTIPDGVSGPCVIRVYLAQGRVHALGSAVVQVHPTPTAIRETAADPVPATVR
jgi:hypothetical protein